MPEEFEKWQAPGYDSEVAYSVAAMESMRRAAVVGLQKIPKRGLEVGGILFGTYDGNRIEIHQWREIDCEHSHGPGFELSESEQTRLQQFLIAAAGDPSLAGFQPVGWFRTRTRGGAYLSEADVELFNRFFPEPWQVALVIRPYTYEPALAGFFIREASGEVQREASHNQFELENRRKRVPVGFDPAQAPRRPVEAESNAWSGRATPRSEAPPLPPDAFPPTPAPGAGAESAESGIPELVRRPPRRTADHPVPVRYGDRPGESTVPSRVRLGVLGGAAFLVILIAVILGVPALSGPSADGIDLRVRDASGQLYLQWNRYGAAVLTATGASLKITDGESVLDLPLTLDELRGGTLTYERTTGNVELALTLHSPKGEPVSEFTQFVGGEPEPSADASMREDLSRAMQEEREYLQQRFEAEASQFEALQTAVNEEKARIGR